MGKAIGIDLGTTNSVAAFKLVKVEVVTADNNTTPIVDELGLAIPVEVEITRKLFEELIADAC